MRRILLLLSLWMSLMGCSMNLGPAAVTMVLVEGGTLRIGSEMAGTTVTSFEIGKYEVTWGEWRAVRSWAAARGYDLLDVGEGSGKRHPVRNVSWYDVVKWCNALSEKEGRIPVYEVNGAVYRSGEYGESGSGAVTMRKGGNGYRLPTEAEWEWAARGGVKTRGSAYSGGNDLPTVGWTYDNSLGASVNLFEGRGTWPVGSKQPNELGLCDMSGNVWEWCWDAVDGTPGRRIRGGSWLHGGILATVANRDTPYYPNYRAYYRGFRVVRSYVQSG